jgi:hypothetical protein
MKILKLLVLLLVAALISSMLFACGETSDDSGGAPAETAAATAAIEEPAIETETTTQEEIILTTAEPTEPPTTAEPFVPDESMSYWEQIEAELAHHGLTGGIPVFQGVDENELMRRLGTSNARRTELDVSGDGVPFSTAWNIVTTQDVPNFWDSNASITFARDLETNIDDLIVGCLWIRGRRTEATDNFFDDDEPIYYMAIKTPTDDWATEGEVTPTGQQFAQDTWQKVFFYGRVMNEEAQSANMIFQIFIGYGLQEFDIGGIIAYKFPGNRDNERAALNLAGW